MRFLLVKKRFGGAAVLLLAIAVGCDEPFPTLGEPTPQEQNGESDPSAARFAARDYFGQSDSSAPTTNAESTRGFGERDANVTGVSDYDRRRGSSPPSSSSREEHDVADSSSSHRQVAPSFRNESVDDSSRENGPRNKRGQGPTNGLTAPSSAGAPQVKLRTGVALAQTLPSGSAMGFNITYQFDRGEPKTSHRYFWEIRRGDGQQAVVPIPRMQQNGQLSTFVTTWPPRTGPFECRIVEMLPNGTRRVISPTADLR